MNYRYISLNTEITYILNLKKDDRHVSMCVANECALGEVRIWEKKRQVLIGVFDSVNGHVL